MGNVLDVGTWEEQLSEGLSPKATVGKVFEGCVQRERGQEEVSISIALQVVAPNIKGLCPFLSLPQELLRFLRLPDIPLEMSYNLKPINECIPTQTDQVKQMLWNFTQCYSPPWGHSGPGTCILGGAGSSPDSQEQGSQQKGSWEEALPSGSLSLWPSPPPPALEKPRSLSRLTSHAKATVSETVGYEVGQL